MNKGIVEINLYSFEELSERVKKQIKLRMGFYFKKWVKEDTLFMSNGHIFEQSSLSFLGLNNSKIIGVKDE